MTLVAIYTRVSKEDSEQPASTRRQAHLCKQFAKSRGWEVAKVWEDVDLSAYTAGVRRPAFEDLLKSVSGGKVDGVLVWKLDRLVRRSADFEKFWVRCDQAGVFLSSATEPIDSSTPMGLAVIRVLVNFANVESTSISLRMRARTEEKARLGTPLWWGRPFGHNERATEVVEVEATLIRDAADRLLAGESVKSIVADWRDQNVPTTRGGAWKPETFTKMIMSPRLAGHNTFRGEVAATDCFPRILDPLVAAKVRALLTPKARGMKPRTLQVLQGLLRCDRCGRMLGQSLRKSKMASGEIQITRCYSCRPPEGCCRTAIKAEFIEDLIVSAVLFRLKARSNRRPRSDPPDNAPERLATAYEDYAQGLRRLSNDYYVERRVTRDEWLAARDGLEHQLNLVRRDLEPGWQQAPNLQVKTSARIRADWERLDLAHKHDIIASELEYATVSSPTKKGSGLEASRVRATWRDDDLQMSETPWTTTGTFGMDAWNPDKWMRTAEVAEVLGLPRWAVGRMVAHGELAAVRFGCENRYLRSDVSKAAKELVGTLTVAQAASALGTDVSLIQREIHRGALPAVRRGRLYFVQPADVDALGETLKHIRSAFIGTKETGRLLKVGARDVWRMVREGHLRAIPRGNRLMIERAGVEALARKLRDLRAGEGAMGIPEIQAEFGLNRYEAGDLLRRGLMPYVRVAGRYRVSREDVAAVVNARRKRGAYRRQPAGSVTIPEAAIRLGVHPRTVWRWIRQGSLPAQRVRERSFVMPEDLQRWEKEFGIDGANLIGTKEAGLILGVCQRTVYSMVVRGDLKASRRGSRIRLERSEVTKAVDRPSSPTPERLCGRR